MVTRAGDQGGDRSEAVFHCVPADSETAIVVFSGRGTKDERFHLFGITQRFPDTTKLLVRDPFDNWYNTGLPGVGDTVEEIAERIKEELGGLGASRILTVGTSMGGYGAILFGCMMGARRAVALVPQTLLDPRLPVLTPAADVELQVPDLAPVMRESPRTRVDLVTGQMSAVDMFHAQRVAGIGSARVLGVPGVGHALTARLQEKGTLWPSIAQLWDGDTPSICEIEPALEPALVERLGEAIFAWGRGDPKAMVEAIALVAERHPEWAPPHVALAKGLTQLGDWSGAAAAFAAAIKASPQPRPRLELATSLIEEGRFAEARAVGREILL